MGELLKGKVILVEIILSKKVHNRTKNGKQNGKKLIRRINVAKYLRKAQANLNARRNAMVATRANVRNPKIPADLAFKMPGSMKK